MHSKVLLCFLLLWCTFINAAPPHFISNGHRIGSSSLFTPRFILNGQRINNLQEWQEFWRNLELNIPRRLYGPYYPPNNPHPVHEKGSSVRETFAESLAPENTPQSTPNSNPSGNSTSAESYKEKEWEKVEECPICLLKFEETDTKKVIPTCRHVFHKECIDEWIVTQVKEGKQFPRCAVCKDILPTRVVDEVKKEHGLENPPVRRMPFPPTYGQWNLANLNRSRFSSNGPWALHSDECPASNGQRNFGHVGTYPYSNNNYPLHGCQQSNNTGPENYYRRLFPNIRQQFPNIRRQFQNIRRQFPNILRQPTSVNSNVSYN